VYLKEIFCSILFVANFFRHRLLSGLPRSGGCGAAGQDQQSAQACQARLVLDGCFPVDGDFQITVALTQDNHDLF